MQKGVNHIALMCKDRYPLPPMNSLGRRTLFIVKQIIFYPLVLGAIVMIALQNKWWKVR